MVSLDGLFLTYNPHYGELGGSGVSTFFEC